MKNLLLILGAFFLIIAIGIGLYPVVSTEVNKLYNQEAIGIYDKQTKEIVHDKKEDMLNLAKKYNGNLSNTVSNVFGPEAFNIDPLYDDVLNVTKDGQIGVVTIPDIDVNLPVYHGTKDNFLDTGAVHMCGTSFPIGGNNTHAVVSAHTAYPGKKFFDDLPTLKKGQYFYFDVLGKEIAYKVYDISVVLPDDVSKLSIIQNKDIATLVTCYPYAVNTHRLLVTGERDISKEKELKTSDINISDQVKAKDNPALILNIIIVSYALFVLLIFVFILFTLIRKTSDCEKCKHCITQTYDNTLYYYCYKKKKYINPDEIKKCVYMKKKKENLVQNITSDANAVGGDINE